MPRKELRRVCLFPFFFFKASCFFSFSHIYCAQIGGSREFCIRLVEICYRCTFKRINEVSLPLLTGHLPAIRFLLSVKKTKSLQNDNLPPRAAGRGKRRPWRMHPHARGDRSDVTSYAREAAKRKGGSGWMENTSAVKGSDCDKWN